MAKEDDKLIEGRDPDRGADGGDTASGSGRFTVHVGKLASGSEQEPIEMVQDVDSGLTDEIVAIIDGKRYSLDDLERLAAEEEAAEAEAAASAARFHIAPVIASFGLSRMSRPRMIGVAMIGATILIYGAILFRFLPQSRVSDAPVARATASLDTAVANETANGPTMVAQDDPIPAVMVPTIEGPVLASYGLPAMGTSQAVLNPKILEQKVRDILWMHAFPDIGVSASHGGEVYLAGSVYGLDEVAQIKRIARRVPGVTSVTFMHPDVHVASGPAFLGAQAVGRPDVWGALVLNVITGSPAEKAGMQSGDIIRAVNNVVVGDGREFNTVMATYQPGARVQIRVARGDAQIYLIARLSDAIVVSMR